MHQSNIIPLATLYSTFSSSDCAVRSSCTVTDVLTVDPKVGRKQLLRTPYPSLQNALDMEMSLGSRTQSDKVLQGWFGISVICALSHTISSLEPVVREYSVLTCWSTEYMVQVRQDDQIRRMIDMVSITDSCPLVSALASMRDIQSSSQVRWFSAYLPRGERVRDYHGA